MQSFPNNCCPAVYGLLTIVVEIGWWDRITHYIGARLGGCFKLLRRRQESAEESDVEEEDIDVQKERYRIQDGELSKAL